MPVAADRSPALYGKVPMLGDFVSRGLPRELVDSWDDGSAAAWRKAAKRWAQTGSDFI